MKKYGLLGCALLLMVQAVASENQDGIQNEDNNLANDTAKMVPAVTQAGNNPKNDARWLHFANSRDNYVYLQGHAHPFPIDENWRPDSFSSEESDSDSFSSDSRGSSEEYDSSGEYSDSSFDDSDISPSDSDSSLSDSSHSSDSSDGHHHPRRTTRRPRTTTTRRPRTTTRWPRTTTTITPTTTTTTPTTTTTRATTRRHTRTTRHRPRPTSTRRPRTTTRRPKSDESSSSSSSSSEEHHKDHPVCVKYPPVTVRRDPDPDRLPIMTTRQKIRVCGIRKERCTCTKYAYRNYDGTCNNLRNPDIGIGHIPLSRLVAARYCDGLSTERRSVEKHWKLPSSRKVTKAVFDCETQRRPHITQLVIAFWLFVAEDIFQLKRRNSEDGEDSHQCCTAQGGVIPHKFLPSSCLPIKVSKNDSFFSQFDQQCINYERIGTSQECREDHHRPIEQINLVPSYLDLSVLYGSRPKEVKLLRKFKKGQLRTKYVRHHKGKSHRQFLPNVHDATEVCGAHGKHDPCYLSPNSQVNKLVTLAALQTLFVRQHNRIARRLLKRNPKWNDEQLFQQSRRILTAIYQSIIYNDWLPLLIGKEALSRWKIPFFKLSSSYDASINPGAISDMVSAGFSLSNTLLPQQIHFMDKNRHVTRRLDLIASIGDPSSLEKGKNFDAVLVGAATQTCEAFDTSFIREMLELELGNGQAPAKGVDLLAIDIQNGRDLGISTYNDARRLCGLKRAKEFDDFKDTIKPEEIKKLKKVYKDPEDVDLAVALYMEKPYDGGLIGQVGSCLFAEQFARLRQGDRFFANAEGFRHSFTKEQLEAILPISLSSIICESSDAVSRMQENAFIQPSPGNPLRKCKKLPRLDLNPWKDLALPDKSC